MVLQRVTGVKGCDFYYKVIRNNNAHLIKTTFYLQRTFLLQN